MKNFFIIFKVHYIVRFFYFFLLFRLNENSNQVKNIQAISENKLVFSSFDGTFKIWNLVSGKCMISTTLHFDGAVNDIYLI